MIVSGMNKLTLIDYPDKTACIIFTQGCNFRCSFCQNSSLLKASNESLVQEKEILDYLAKRKKVIDGICISGGEPLMQNDIKEFIKKVKEIGISVKLDTNGSYPDKLNNLIQENLLDYVAMDIKNDFKSYSKITEIKNFNLEKIKKSIDILKKSNIDYEFRTTVVKEFHTFDKLKSICEYIGPKAKYFIQNFRDSDDVLRKNLHGFSEEELLDIIKKLNEKYPKVTLRNI